MKTRVMNPLLTSALFLFASQKTFAVNCVKDIFSVGAGAAGHNFISTDFNNKRHEVRAEYGLDLRLEWIVFCYRQNLEITSYLGLKHIYLDNERPNVPRDIKEENNFARAGVELKKSKPFGWNRIEIPFEFGIRDDLGFYQWGMGPVRTEAYQNFKFATGIAYIIKQNDSYNLSTEFRFGRLMPDSDGRDGDIHSLALEYYKKLSNKSASNIRLYYEEYEQDIEGNSIRHEEIGILSQYVFRY